MTEHDSTNFWVPRFWGWKGFRLRAGPLGVA